MTTIQLRRGLAADWATKNPILAAGEPGFAIDTETLRIGDGVTHWVNLTSIEVGGLGGVNAVSAPGPLAPGQTNAVSASGGAIAVSMPAAASRGVLTPVYKSDGTTNTVTITLKLRGSGSTSTLTLKTQFQTLLLLSRADGTYDVISDHKTEAALDSRYLPATYTLAARPTATGSKQVIWVSDVAGGQLQQDTAAGVWTPLAPGVSQGNLGLVAETVSTADAPVGGTTSTSPVDAGISVTWTAVAGATYETRLKCLYKNSTAGKITGFSITTSGGTVLDQATPVCAAASSGYSAYLVGTTTPGAGSVTHKIQISTSSAGTAFLLGGATYPLRLGVYRVA